MRPTDAIVAGNITSTAWSFLEQHGARIEEVRDLYFIFLPEEADISNEHGCDTCQRPREYVISFEQDQDTQNSIAVAVELSLMAYESRVYTLLR